MTAVYFAGKMGSGMGACDCGLEVCHPRCEQEHGHKCGSTYIEHNWRYEILHQIPSMERRLTLRSKHVFSGPWFVDTNNHDMDAEHVAERCLGWIADSDCVFAWITTLDAHGTLAELGYAKALKKPVFAAFDRDRLSDNDIRQMWFIRDLADGHAIVRRPEVAFSIFTHWLNAHHRRSVPFGSRW